MAHDTNILEDDANGVRGRQRNCQIPVVNGITHKLDTVWGPQTLGGHYDVDDKLHKTCLLATKLWQYTADVSHRTSMSCKLCIRYSICWLTIYEQCTVADRLSNLWFYVCVEMFVVSSFFVTTVRTSSYISSNSLDLQMTG